MRRIPLLITIFTVAVLMVAAVIIGLLYRTSLDQESARLREVAHSQARMIEAIARHEAQYCHLISAESGHGDAFASTLAQLRDANSRFDGFGRTGEYTLARREGDSIVYLLRQRHPGSSNLIVIPFNGARGEPMRRALSGRSGTVIGLDNRGVKVLAAHEPVEAFGLGVVAKIDMAEVQAPFVRAGLISIVTAFAVVLLGSFLFYRTTNPVLGQLEESEERLKDAEKLSHLGSWSLDLVENKLTWSDEVYRIFGLRPQEFEATYEAFLAAVHPDDRAEVDAAYADSVHDDRDGYEIEHRVVRKSTGEVRIVLEKCEHFRDTAGRIIRSIGMVHDITERKQAEEALRGSEERLRRLYAAMSEGLALHQVVYDDSGKSVDYRILDVNPAFETITGISRDKAIGRVASELYGTGSPPYIDTYAKVAETSKPAEFETDFAPMGKCFRISVFSPGKGIFATVFSDITARKQTERRLAEQAAMLSQVSDAIIGVDADYRITYWSPAAERLYGYSASEARGRTIAELTRITYVDKPREAAIAELNRTDHSETETIQHTRDGRELVVETHAAALRDQAGAITAIVAVNRDVTERRLAEQALRRANERLGLAQQSAAAGIWDWDMTTNKLEWSPELFELFGLDPTRAKADFETWRGVLHPDDRAAAEVRIDLAVKSRERLESEYRIVLSSGETRWVSAVGDTLYDLAGRPLRMSGICIDITQRKRAEERLRLTLDELKRSNDDLEQFAYAASHDLQQPLRMVASYVGLLSERYRGKLDERADRYVDYAVNGARRMQSLIEGLLHYARAGTKGDVATELDLAAVVAEARGNVSRHIGEAGAVVDVGPLPRVTADRVQLVQVFQNLLDNAVKFRGAVQPAVSISCRDAGDRWEFAVRDNGIGIDPKYADRIFGVFKRLHTEQEYPGTGIGLALCRKIVERHGGRIWVEPAEGGGSVFRFTLPKQPGARTDESAVIAT